MCTSAFALFLCMLCYIIEFSTELQLLKQQRLNTKLSERISRLDAVMLDTTAVSLVAGAFAGSIGVGVSYPFDSLKTKTQGLILHFGIVINRSF